MTDNIIDLKVTDGSSSSNQESSAWDIDQLNHNEESNSTDDFFSTLKRRITQHVYHNTGPEKKESCLPAEKKHCSMPATVRIDSSDLISRCRTFLPLLTDANRILQSKIESGENVRVEIDSDEDDGSCSDPLSDKKTIEMDLLFCPEEDSASTSDESDDEKLTSDNYQTAILHSAASKQQLDKPVHIVELNSEEFSDEKFQIREK